MEKSGILAFKQRQYLVRKQQKASHFDHAGCQSELGTSLLCRPKGVAPGLCPDRPPAGIGWNPGSCTGLGATATCPLLSVYLLPPLEARNDGGRDTLPPVLLADSYLSSKTSPKHLCSGGLFLFSKGGSTLS